MKGTSEKRAVRFYLKTIVFSLLLTVLFSISALAASNTPGKVYGVKGTVKESRVDLSWKKVKNASGYYIYVEDVKKHDLHRAYQIKGGSKLSKTVWHLTNGHTYNIYVSAYRVVSGKTYEGKKSAVQTFKVIPLQLAAPKVTVKKCTNSSITLTWPADPKATGYQLYLENSSGKYKKVGKITKKTTVTVWKLTEGKQYNFKVRAIREVDGYKRYGLSGYVTGYVYSDQMKVNKANSVITDYVYARSARRNPAHVYDKFTAECYVNYGKGGKAFASLNNYLIWVNYYSLKVYIFQRASASQPWTLLRWCACIVGADSEETKTPYMVTRIVAREPYRDYGGGCVAYEMSFMSPCVYKNGIHVGFSFHSVLTTQGVYPNGLTQGYLASQGCVRVNRDVSKFIYANCMNSTVVLH